jgi:hypothetical protein
VMEALTALARCAAARPAQAAKRVGQKRWSTVPSPAVGLGQGGKNNTPLVRR